ncbi:MAG: HAD family hydrolase [Deltaproteobacteria bacterium]|nr:HAD family hydrolase [Deltaproteobacteria bacterium]
MGLPVEVGRWRARKGKAVFLDRDGVLVEDVGLLARPEDIRVLAGAAEALAKLRQAGYLLVVISNQASVARGILSEAAACELHEHVQWELRACGAPHLDGFYFCPHHPHANLPEYRRACDCRKPRPGLILRASTERDVDPSTSFMVGDRLTDVWAGARAGCRTVLVETGKHAEPLIVTSDPPDEAVAPQRTCRDLGEAARWILEQGASP